MDLVAYFLATGVAFRLAYFIVRDEGPFGVALWIRSAVDPHRTTWIGRGLNCIVCTSFWTSLLVAFFIPGELWFNWLGIAGACVVLAELTLLRR